MGAVGTSDAPAKGSTETIPPGLIGGSGVVAVAGTVLGAGGTGVGVGTADG